ASLDVDRWYSSSQSPIKFEACRTSSRGRLFPFLDAVISGCFAVGCPCSGHDERRAASPLGFPGDFGFLRQGNQR
ncbi:MAG: hypothetical protein DI595_22215, partial [Agrobacterium fabrum]